MFAGRFQRLQVRHKLLAIALLPLVVILPLLALIVLLWGNVTLDRLLITKVRSDLAVAQGYFDRVLGEVSAGTEAIAASQRLYRALQPDAPKALQPMLHNFRSEAHLDFLNLHGTDGRLLATDWGMPNATVRSRMLPDTRHAVGAAVEIVDLDRLAELAPHLRERVVIPLVPTRGAAPTSRTQEDRAMVVLASAPVRGTDGGVIGHLQGGVLLNRNLPFIDHINEIVYPAGSLPFGSKGTATLFLDDVRITTNVRLFNERAIGTRVSQAVYNAVIERGGTWLDSAFVVDDWYVSAYQPLTDRSGKRIGMLYVGFLEEPFIWLKYGVLASIGISCLAVMLVAAWLALRWARVIFRPLEQMTQTMQRVESGALDARVGNVDTQDEIGALAGHLDHLLDTIDDKTRALQRWGLELDRKVAERTSDLEASNASLKSAQQQLVKSEKLAAIGQLTASIAHEVNNPIAVIQGNLDLLRELLGPQAQVAGAELRLIDEQIERMRLIVTQLLQFARPTEYAGYVEAIDPAEAIEASLVLVAHLLASTHIELRRAFATHRKVGINRSELQQVLINLMVNAIHAMPNGGRLTLATRPWDDDGVEIVIADTGPGLPQAVLDQIFHPFFTTKAEGTGLGLWISRGIVERYGGDIGARNAPGMSGAVFSIYLRTEPRTDMLHPPPSAAATLS
jgi:two-component system NtrC family sensor kinase